MPYRVHRQLDAEAHAVGDGEHPGVDIAETRACGFGCLGESSS